MKLFLVFVLVLPLSLQFTVKPDVDVILKTLRDNEVSFLDDTPVRDSVSGDWLHLDLLASDANLEELEDDGVFDTIRGRVKNAKNAVQNKVQAGVAKLEDWKKKGLLNPVGWAKDMAQMRLVRDQQTGKMGLKIAGNYCGPGHGGANNGPTQGGIDACCKTHDACYGAKGYFNCECDTNLKSCNAKVNCTDGSCNRIRAAINGAFNIINKKACKATKAITRK
jgi:hypothetical protein